MSADERVTAAGDRERVLLLECRLEEMRSALDASREEADRARTKLAEAAVREADHARRYNLIHEELAEARSEVATLHRHLERSEALRAEIAGHLFEAGPRADAQELVRLRKKVLAEDQRSVVSDRTVARLRERIEELVSSRETLLTRIAEWQQLIREDGPEAADLSEFLAELRREILDLEHQNVVGSAREHALRERLAMAGIDPDRGDPEPAPAPEPPAEPASPPLDGPEATAWSVSEEETASVGPVETGPAPEAEETRAIDPSEEPEEAREPEDLEEADGLREVPTRVPPSGWHASPPGRSDALLAELRETGVPALQADLLLRLGRSGDAGIADVVHPWTESPEPSVRAAAYEALGRLLDRVPDTLEIHLRRGLADPDARVRRRVALAAGTARGLSSRALLDPLQEDPDPQVRRVVRQVLRQSGAARSPSVSNRSARA